MFLVALPLFKGDAPLSSLTQKGYGHVYGANDMANLAMSYANVDGGSAPAAGDLVVWLAFGHDGEDDPIASLASAGWEQAKTTWNSTIDVATTIAAKVVTAGDISSPANIITAPEGGSVGYWVAYTATGNVESLSATAAISVGKSVAPSNVVLNSSASSPKFAVTMGVGTGEDDSPTLTMSGATADINIAANGIALSSLLDARFQANLSAGGANITFSKSDDGLLTNYICAGYVLVN